MVNPSTTVEDDVRSPPYTTFDWLTPIPCMSIVVARPVGADQRRQRTGKPGIEDVSFAAETTGLAALLGRVAGGYIGHRIDGQLLAPRHDRVRVVAIALVVERVPDWDRHTEVALTTDAPIELQALGPVSIAHLHELRMPLDPFTLLEQLVLLVE